MYAEERQQAIADLVAQRGRLSVTTLAEEFGVTTETVRRDLSVLERAGLLRRVHGGAVPAGALTRDRDRRSRARPGQHRREGPDRRGPRSTCCPRPAARAARRRHAPPRRLAGAAPPRPAARRRHPRGADRRPARRAPPASTCTCCPAGSARTTQAAVGAETVARAAELRVDVAFIGTNGITAGHGLTTPDRDEAAAKRAMVARRPAGGRARRLPQDRRREHPSGSRDLGDVDVLVTDDGIDRRRPHGPRGRRRRGRGRMIVTLTANPSLDRTVDAGRTARARRACSGPTR